MLNQPAPQTVSPRAVLSLVLGLVTLLAIPFLSMLAAPCGFPLALVTGISAILTGVKEKKDAVAHGNGRGSWAAAGVITGWAGIAVNTVVMLIKLAMFVVLIAIPLLAIFHLVKSR